MSFWRKLNKAVFIISLAFSCIAVIVGAIWGFSQKSEGPGGVDNSWFGAVILFGGIVLILVLFSLWGIFIEFLDNVADIRNAVCGGQRILSKKQVYSVQSNQSVQQANNGVQVTDGNITPASSQETPVPQAEAVYIEQVITSGKWTCTGCGKNNDADSGFCYNCGKPRE